LAQAREHSAVNVAMDSPVPVRPRRARPLACAVAGVLLVMDAVFLMSLGVFSLGVTLPFALGVLLLALGLKWDATQAWLDRRPQRRAAWRWAWIGFAVWLCTVAAFWAVLAGVGHGSITAVAPKAIVVLGSGTPNGKVSPVLAARLDVALEQARRFPDAVVVVSGGVDFGEHQSEGRIMGDYLRDKGLPPARILQEERSSSTEENLVFSKPLLKQRGVSEGDAIQVVTSDFHTLRAGWIAKRNGYTAVALQGAPTPLYVRYNAWLREYFAVLNGFVLREFA
jgi:uncharacterized SAM-binding protein YcdF (DUF218 family)